MKELATKHKKGLSKKEQYLFSTTYNTFIQVNVQELLTELLPYFDGYYDDEERAMTKALLQYFNKITYTGVDIKNNTFGVTFDVEFKSSTQNSLTSFMSYINTQIMLFKSERAMRKEEN